MHLCLGDFNYRIASVPKGAGIDQNRRTKTVNAARFVHMPTDGQKRLMVFNKRPNRPAARMLYKKLHIQVCSPGGLMGHKHKPAARHNSGQRPFQYL